MQSDEENDLHLSESTPKHENHEQVDQEESLLNPPSDKEDDKKIQAATSPLDEGSYQSKHYCLSKKKEGLLQQKFFEKCELKEDFPPIQFAKKEMISRPASSKFRVGMEVFVCSKWLKDTAKAETKFIFFGISCAPDYRYAPCLLYDLSSDTCCSAPILYVGKVPKNHGGRAHPDTASDVDRANPVVFEALRMLSLSRDSLDALNIQKSHLRKSFKVSDKHKSPVSVQPDKPVSTPQHMREIRKNLSSLSSQISSLKSDRDGKKGNAGQKLVADNARLSAEIAALKEEKKALIKENGFLKSALDKSEKKNENLQQKMVEFATAKVLNPSQSQHSCDKGKKRSKLAASMMSESSDSNSSEDSGSSSSDSSLNSEEEKVFIKLQQKQI